MEIATHQRIDQRLCGDPLQLEEGFSRVALRTLREMAADDTGLVHGGFIFGLADYAAMIAVNHPHVVLGAAEVSFAKPVSVGETVTAEATADPASGKKRLVRVTVFREETPVFTGTFTCFVLDRHVLG
jgi:uncharacterized protein (TIGR00369 family)